MLRYSLTSCGIDDGGALSAPMLAVVEVPLQGGDKCVVAETDEHAMAPALLSWMRPPSVLSMGIDVTPSTTMLNADHYLLLLKSPADGNLLATGFAAPDHATVSERSTGQQLKRFSLSPSPIAARTTTPQSHGGSDEALTFCHNLASPRGVPQTLQPRPPSSASRLLNPLALRPPFGLH